MYGSRKPPVANCRADIIAMATETLNQHPSGFRQVMDIYEGYANLPRHPNRHRHCDIATDLHITSRMRLVPVNPAPEPQCLALMLVPSEQVELSGVVYSLISFGNFFQPEKSEVGVWCCAG